MKLKVVLPPLHPGQMEIREALNKHRFVVALTGRRFGKTTGALIIALERALTYPNYVVWWVAPTYKICLISYRLFKRICPPDVIRYKSDSDLYVEFVNGSTFTWRSADRPESLLGEGINLLIFDEAAVASPEAWECISPALSDKRGQALFLSRPSGVWLRELAETLEKSGEGVVIKKRSCDNPFFPPEEWEKAKKRLPPMVFKAEYEAEWVTGASAVFPRAWEALQKRTTPVLARTVLGVDPGRTRDFFAVACVNSARQILWLEHRQGVPFDLQMNRILELARQFDAEIWIDSHALGGMAFYEMLARSGIGHRLHPYPVKDRATRNELIELLAWALDPSVTPDHLVLASNFPPTCEPTLQELRRELEAMNYEVTPSGEIKYVCEKGVHDDVIIALALAVKGLTFLARPKPVVTASLPVAQFGRRRVLGRKYSALVGRKYALARTHR